MFVKENSQNEAVSAETAWLNSTALMCRCWNISEPEANYFISASFSPLNSHSLSISVSEMLPVTNIINKTFHNLLAYH